MVYPYVSVGKIYFFPSGFIQDFLFDFGFLKFECLLPRCYILLGVICASWIYGLMSTKCLKLPWQTTTNWIADNNKFSLSQIWRLEIWNPGVNRAMFPLKAVGRIFSCFFLGAGNCWQSLAFLGVELNASAVSVFTWPFSLWVRLHLHMNCLQEQNSLDLGPTQIQYAVLLRNSTHQASISK